ncbi:MULTISPECIES: phage tail assembly chaperone G [Thermoanaerobacterium]|uniref:Phage-like protein n=2 Tax=Thermoanaerobacterium TaxID=28895 RepID=W9E7Z8_9THEO|nr:MULTISPECIES: hypothetical protein [Thermoanaerobacterium]AFK87416.1 phage-like protein [Thermoanaerobacterium saccharolyticum JW/SL-YS485]ETO37787.1 phage-like protein [Thermoanaerobacterium aotearoense SCUT27]
MEITLNNKTYIAPATKARVVRKAIEITEKINFNEIKTKDLDNLIDYVVELFGRQFTIDDVYDGLEANKLIPTIMDCIKGVVGEVGAKLEQFPNAQTGK